MKSDRDNTIYAEITINAPRQKVWDVLTDFKKLPEWSSSFQNLEIEGDMRNDAKATSYFKDPNGNMMVFHHHLVEVEMGYSFGWADPLMFQGLQMTDHHVYHLKDLPDGKTLFYQTDAVLDVASDEARQLAEQAIGDSYKEFNKELKKRVEALHPAMPA